MTLPPRSISVALLLALNLPAQDPAPTNPAPQPPAGRAGPISGVHPHLAMFNGSGECGTGAVVTWQGHLWAITYAPHKPVGSDDQLYQITPELDLRPFAGSVGGTPANRMIHQETQQLLIGPYLIDARRKIRVIPSAAMPGRLTGVARHLTDPAHQVYYATMEEGIYAVDVESLAVTELFADHQSQIGGRADAEAAARLMEMPGYHGKGLYSGQGRLIYANNGEAGGAAQRRPDVPSGVLAEWTGGDEPWRVVRRAQFTDIRGPGGLLGNTDPQNDPVWAIGWDHRSLLLMLLEDGEWSTYRLPKASHCYDGAHGWNTEWPRFRDLGDPDHITFNMHGMFWKLPRGFANDNAAGVAPRSTYLKVVGDYTRWGDQLVLGCDDTAKNEFLNKRRAKGGLRGPGTSHSNFWFVNPDTLDRLGPPLGRGAVWLRDDVTADQASDPYLCSRAGGDRRFRHRTLVLWHGADTARSFHLEFDLDGSGDWVRQATVDVAAGEALFQMLPDALPAEWLRLVPTADTPAVTAMLHDRAVDSRPSSGTPATRNDARFLPLVADGTTDAAVHSSGLLYMRPGPRRSLSLALDPRDDDTGPQHYELRLDGDSRGLLLEPAADQDATPAVRAAAPIPTGILEHDAASVIYTDDDGARWRLPRCREDFRPTSPFPVERADREVVTERDLFNAGGLFYELPARNAGGFAKIRPIASHGLRIRDYASYRGLLVLSGIAKEAPAEHPQLIRSSDGRAALWLGVVDDLWSAGKPIGIGGPWLDTEVRANAPSDPYLLTGFDEVELSMRHAASSPVTFTVELDVTGDGGWVRYRDFNVPPSQLVRHRPGGTFSGYWVRVRSDVDLPRATMQLRYR